MAGDTEFSGIKADSLRKALRAREARVECWDWDRAGSSICASTLSLWQEKQELKVRVQPLTVRKTKQAAKRVCSGFMSYASIPGTKVKFINPCEALGYRRRQYQSTRQALLRLISCCHCKALTHSTWVFFDTKQQISWNSSSFRNKKPTTSNLKPSAGERHYFLL